MNLRQLRKRCEARLRELDIPQPFDVRDFCRTLAGRRGRPIALEPVIGPTAPFGLWIATPLADIILYERQTSTPHQDHIILHELCHILCGHEARPETTGIASTAIFSTLSPDTVRHVLQRAAYSTDDEREAEVMASTILARAGATDETPRAASAAVERLSATLKDG